MRKKGIWNDTDIELVCDVLVKDCLEYIRVDQYIKDFSNKNGGALPVILIDYFNNRTNENINLQIIKEKMSLRLIKSDRFKILGYSPAAEVTYETIETTDTDIDVDETENAKNSEELPIADNAEANLRLIGEVRSIIKQTGNKFTRVYYIKTNLIKIDSDRVIWEADATVEKRIRERGIEL